MAVEMRRGAQLSPRRRSADCSSGVGWKQTADLGQMVGYSSTTWIVCAQPLWGPYKKGVTEGVALTVRGGRGGTPLPGAQHGETAGWAGRTHEHLHIMRVACGLDNTTGVEKFVEGGRPEGNGKMIGSVSARASRRPAGDLASNRACCPTSRSAA